MASLESGGQSEESRVSETDVLSTTGISGETRRPPSATRIPVLENGDRLTRCEFERRYTARPDIRKAELIEGVVHMPSPVRPVEHAEPHAAVLGALFHYCAFTPGARVADNATVRLDAHNEPQPDALLRLDEEMGGKSHVGEDGYLEGAPELIVEVASSSASLDMRDKRRVYRRSGVREYIVWRTQHKSIEWFDLVGGEYRPLPRDGRGVVESRVFPGLRLATDALIAGNLSAVLAEVDKGIGSPRHREFVTRLAANM